MVAAVETKLAQAKLEEGTRISTRGHATGNAITSLIPVVTATCPNRLNQPVTQDAKEAPWGLEIMAAQKYGPPLVGCALHISRAACHKTVFFRACRENVPAIAKPTNIVKKAV
jgi:hypothetical protein